jgi:hypothetical protein
LGWHSNSKAVGVTVEVPVVAGPHVLVGVVVRNACSAVELEKESVVLITEFLILLPLFKVLPPQLLIVSL